MRNDKKDVHEVKIIMPLAMFVTAVLSVVTTLTTYNGLMLYTEPSSYLGLIIITMVSLTIGVTSFAVWHYLYQTIPAAIVNKNWPSLGTALFAMMWHLVLVGSISMYSNAVGLYGTEAVKLDYSARVDEAVEKIKSTFEIAYNFETMIIQLRGKADIFEGFKQRELDSGEISGTRGTGAISAAFSTASLKLATYSDTFEAKTKRLPDYQKEAKEIIKKLRKVYEGNRSASDRKSEITLLRLELETILSKVSALISAKNISSLANESKNFFQFTQEGSKNRRFRAKQKTILASQQNDLNSVMDGLLSLAKSYEEAAPKKGSLFKEISISDATIKYARDFLPAVALAIGLDLYALVILILLISATLYRYRLSPYHDLTVREAARIHGIWQDQLDNAQNNTQNPSQNHKQ